MSRISLIALLCLGWLASPLANAADQPDDEASIRQRLVHTILASGDEQQKSLNDLADHPSKLVNATLLAWTKSEIFIYETPNDGPKVPVTIEEQQNADGKSHAIRLDTGKPLTDDKGAPLSFDTNDLNPVDTEMRTMSAIGQVLDALALADPNATIRSDAAAKLGKSRKPQYIPIIQARLDKEKDGKVKKALRIALANLNLNNPDPVVKIKGINELSHLSAIGSLDDLRKLGSDANPEVATAAKAAVKSIEGYIQVVNFFGTIFRGMSLGSILLVVSLGLAITFGLMGIINMAHGEMIAIGAYTSYVVENVFTSGFTFHVNLPFSFFGKPMGFGLAIPGMHTVPGTPFYESYFLFVIPLAFIMSALAGLVLERAVIQFLYRRPLESLLATWGVSLCMQQSFRLVFGANNVQINSPRWLTGNFTFFDIIFGYNRIFVISFAILIVIGTWLLLTKTPLGLLIRAVMQNRDMAACMGVPTQRVNMLTFAFGSGLAGLAGAFLSQIGNVGPSMGQPLIVDSFMIVVVGGVGNIVGTIYASLGYGTADQVLQQVFNSPVVGKITVLIAIILFLQWKPGGLFPTRSRSLEG